MWQSPGELDDLGEVLKDCEAGYEADMSSGITPSMHTRHSKRKPNKEVSANGVFSFFASASSATSLGHKLHCVPLPLQMWKGFT